MRQQPRFPLHRLAKSHKRLLVLMSVPLPIPSAVPSLTSAVSSGVLERTHPMRLAITCTCVSTAMPLTLGRTQQIALRCERLQPGELDERGRRGWKGRRDREEGRRKGRKNWGSRLSEGHGEVQSGHLAPDACRALTDKAITHRHTKRE